MIKTLRLKLLLGIMPLLILMIGQGLWAVSLFTRLGSDIDVILRENYLSVRAAQSMKEALERMDSSQWFAIGGEEARARTQYDRSRIAFEDGLRIEQGNITLPGEREMVRALVALRDRYVERASRFFELTSSRDRTERTEFYFRELLPTFEAIKAKADEILELNQKQMEVANGQARSTAAFSTRLMIFAMLGSALVASVFALALSRSILGPIKAVTLGARDMAAGNLDQVVPSTTRDELGELADAFNAMARTIRAFRQAGTARLLRAQRTAQATIDSFPDPVIVVDPTGSVERANPAARRILGVVPSGSNGHALWSPPVELRESIAEALSGDGATIRPPAGLDQAMVCRDDGQERSFLPSVLPIRDEDAGLIGAAVVLTDVTRFRRLDQLKSDMVSTVSHELKTPLTGVQMAVHLLLEEAVGPLNPKQVELMLAARQDADRLLAMIEDLLDLTRIEQEGVRLNIEATSPADLMAEAMTRFETRANDAGVSLQIQPAVGLPPVQVDRERVSHLFDNVLGNALVHAGRGGSVQVSAEVAEGGVVRFSVADTGEGIAPEHLPHLFEKFYRVPGSRSTGAGLGLAIAREIALSHGGGIDVSGEPGLGATFRFTLPIVPGTEGAKS